MKFFGFLAMAFLMTAISRSHADDAARDEVAPFVGDETIAVVRLDLAHFEIGPLAGAVFGEIVADDRVNDPIAAADARIKALRQLGFKDLYILIDPADFLNHPVVVAIPAAGADLKAIGALLCGGDQNAKTSPFVLPVCAIVHDRVVAGSNEGVERIRSLKRVDRPDLFGALAAAGESPVSIAIAPSPLQRRILDEMVPTFPKEIGGGSIESVTRGIEWASLALVAIPKPVIHVVVRARDADSANRFVAIGKNAFQYLNKITQNQPPIAAMIKDLAAIEPKIEGNSIAITVELERARSLISTPLRSARLASGRSQCMNNLKMIGLAMHNEHAANNSFPPAFSRDNTGMPLLSWRVRLLPYLDQEALFKEFKQDEPWDGPHNKALIAKMPAVYACPASSSKLAASGKTTYVVPRGKRTIFPGAEGMSIKMITDGTSNTILVVDVPDEKAVVWTKPDDWETDPDFSPAEFIHHHGEGTNVTFADGSVRFFKSTIKLEVLRALLTRNGGEVINQDDF